MKKVIAIALCLAVLFTLSVSAFAVSDSVKSEVKYIVVMRKGIGVTGITSNDTNTTIQDGDVITAKADPAQGTFNSWGIYKGDGTTATEGVDYNLVNGTTLTSTQISVQAKTNLILCANYNGTITAPGKIETTETSPKTADMSVVYVAVMLAAAAVVFGAKKVYSK